MSEVVNSYLISHPEKLIPMDRAEFYEEQKLLHETGKAPDKYIEVVNIFIFTEKGEMIVQKRSSRKNHNPNLLDKAVG